MENISNDVNYVFHNSTLYLLLYAFVQVACYLAHSIRTNEIVVFYFLKLHKKIRKTYCYYMKSNKYQETSKKIETLKKKIKKYNKLIDENKNSNKHLNEYDLIILNGKYTRKVLKEENNLNDLMKILEEENKNDYLIHTCNTLLAFLFSKNTLVLFFFLSFKYFATDHLEIPSLNMHSCLWFKRNFKIIYATEPCSNSLFDFLYGYNTAQLFFFTIKQNLGSLFVITKQKQEKKKKAM
ncbi:conserved Plasmodium protein, unknown function [Plasmodium malariae]|uniref:Uncharacterized protein n=1 Tax=Plasmodium malariae TaxID=5858 RepID=A0A1C3KB24_PLAMA|nr:conserved Plasmodium protein, unknown function [Plasmodium malariae]